MCVCVRVCVCVRSCAVKSCTPLPALIPPDKFRVKGLRFRVQDLGCEQWCHNCRRQSTRPRSSAHGAGPAPSHLPSLSSIDRCSSRRVFFCSSRRVLGCMQQEQIPAGADPSRRGPRERPRAQACAGLQTLPRCPTRRTRRGALRGQFRNSEKSYSRDLVNSKYIALTFSEFSAARSCCCQR